MENFFKNLERITEVMAAAKEEIDRQENQRRQAIMDESIGSQVPRPSAPSYDAVQATEQLARQPSVSSGYGSASSSMNSSRNSSRRNSDVSIDDEVFQNETRALARINSPQVAAARQPALDQAVDPAGAFLGALAIGALAVGAFYAGKTLLGKKQILLETFEDCVPILKEIKKFVDSIMVVD